MERLSPTAQHERTVRRLGSVGANIANIDTVRLQSVTDYRPVKAPSCLPQSQSGTGAKQSQPTTDMTDLVWCAPRQRKLVSWCFKPSQPQRAEKERERQTETDKTTVYFRRPPTSGNRDRERKTDRQGQTSRQRQRKKKRQRERRQIGR